MIFSNRYVLHGVVVETGEEFQYCKTQKKRTERFSALTGFVAGKKHDYIETPCKLQLRSGYSVELLDEGTRGRIINFEEEIYNEIQSVFTAFSDVEKVFILELDTNA